jgi:transposase
MSQPTTRKYPAACKERAVKLAVASEQPIAQTARDLGVNENTLHTWLGKYHRAERRGQQVQDEHLYEALQRLRKANPRLQEEREIVKTAAAYLAPQLPASTPGCTSSTPRSSSVAWVSSWRSRAVATTRGSAAHSGPQRPPIRRCKTKYSDIVRKAVAPRARAGSSICWHRRVSRSAGAALGACWLRRGCAATPGAHAQPHRLQGRRSRWRRTNGTERARCKSLRRLTSGIFPLFLRAKAGCLLLSCSICARERWSDGPGLTRCAQSWCTKRWRWRSVSASPRRG